MKIVVCIKQVPATNEAKIDPLTKRIVREGLKAVMNPFDAYAVEEAIRLKEKCGAEVIVISMGPEKAQRCLREAVSLGADRAVLLSDRAFGGSDTWATSYVLSKAIEKIGQVDLVICGKQAVDGDTAQVGPGIAAHLDFAQATFVMKVEKVDRRHIRVQRMRENGYDVCDIKLPAVITVVKDINMPRVPTLKGRLASDEIDIPIWRPEDIKADIEKIGLDGSPTRVVKTQPPKARSRKTIRIEGSPQECAKQLAQRLREEDSISGANI
ncbi:MAG: Acryloyl-CoA reductase electron transfer subunit gamma [Firmicutes bacterium ADurb.Bin300]|nr:MAG: Acryloyl-CoA reductase electron transfer subunit gamma [Firmicutes bacterium ADurb.Bin300]